METETELKDHECDVCHKRGHVKYYPDDIMLWLCDACILIFFPEEENANAPATV